MRKNTPTKRSKKRAPRRPAFCDGEHIPKLMAFAEVTRTIRFRNSAVYNGPLNVGGLLMAAGMVQFANNSSACVFKSLKVHRIRIWAAPKTDSTGERRIADVQWASSSGFSKGQKPYDVSISNAEPLFIETRPDKNSLCSSWMSLFTVQYANINLPDIGAIVDVHASFVQNNGQGVNVTTALIGTVGTQYFGYLDSTGSGNIAVVGPIGSTGLATY
jgi:hypothetical protein